MRCCLWYHEVVLALTMYYLYISLYASFNLAVGIIIICGFAYNPRLDFHHLADLFTGLVVLAVSAVCFAGLRMRSDNKPKAIKIRRKMGHVLTLVLLPILMLCLAVNLFVTPSVDLLVASVLSFLAASFTFILVQNRLHSPLFRPRNKR